MNSLWFFFCGFATCGIFLLLFTPRTKIWRAGYRKGIKVGELERQQLRSQVDTEAQRLNERIRVLTIRLEGLTKQTAYSNSSQRQKAVLPFFSIANRFEQRK